MAAASSVSAAGAIEALTALVGAGGLSAIIVAWLGYARAARAGRQANPSLPPPAQVGIATLYAEQAALQQTAQAMAALANVVGQLAAAIDAGAAGERVEKLIDEIRELRRAVEDLRHRR